MGRRGSDLASFIRKALKSNKYPNLKLILKNPLIFSLRLLRKTTKLDPAFEQILKDWRALKKREYTYSKAKQAVETALKKSDFFQLIAKEGDEFVYQILEETDILCKKRTKRELKKKVIEYSNILSIESSESSGYGSGEDTGESSPEKREDKLEEVPATVSSDRTENDDMVTESPEDEFEEVTVTLSALSMENYMLTESPEEGVMEEGGQGLIDPNLVLGAQSYGYYFPNLETGSYDQLDLTSVNPNDILDAKINLDPHFKELEDGEEKSINVQNDADFNFDNFYLQKEFEDIDTSGSDASVEELMDIPNSELDPQMSEKSKMSLFHLKKILPTDDGTFLVFSHKLADETNDERNDSEGPSRIFVDKEQLQKITDARHPITVGISNGEPFVYVKHKKFA